MDSENSKSSSSNLIILSPEDLAKLGLNLLVPNESRKNSKDAQSSASHSKKQKHAVRNNVKSSNSSSSAILQTQQSVDSHVNNLTEDIPENESILPKKRRGRPKKISKDTCNKSSAEPPSTSKDYNVPKSKKIMPTKNVEEVRFKKPISNLIAKIVAKKLKDKSAVLDAQKSENHRVHSEKETREFEKNSKNTCIIQPEQTVIDKSIPEEICERPNLQESGEQIGTDSDNSMGIRTCENNTTEAGIKQEHIEKQPRKHEPILENEIFKSQKESILSGEIANQLGIEKIKSPLIEVSPSPAKNINKGVIVLSNTAVSFSHEELKNLIAPMKMISSIQSIRNLDEDTTSETTVEANNSNQIPSSESIHEDDSCLFKQPDCGEKKITGNFNDDGKNTTNIIEHSEHIDISENMLSQKDMTKDTGDSLEPITEVVIQEGELPNTSHENECTPEEKKIRNNLKKKIEEYKMCSKSSKSSKSFKDKNLRDPNLEIESKSSTGMQQKLLDISTKEPKELIENRVTVLEESSSKNDHLFVEGAKNSRSNDNKKIRRSRIVCGPKIVGQSTHKSNKEFSLNEQMNENQLVTENSSHNTMEVESENKIEQCTIQKSHVSNEISGEIVQQNVKECGLQENAQGTMDQCGESSIMSSESVMTENQSLDLCLGNQSLQVQNSKQEELVLTNVGASIVASEQDEPMSPISLFKNREEGIRLETSTDSNSSIPVDNMNLTNMRTLEHDMKGSNSESQCLDDSSLNIGEHAIVSLDIGKIEEQSHEKSNFPNTKSQSDQINAGFHIDDSSKRQYSQKSSVVSINDLVESKSDDSLISTKSEMEMQEIIMPELGTRFDDEQKIDQIDEHLKRVPSDCINDEKHNSLSENQSDTINASHISTNKFGSSDIFEETHSDREYKREMQKKSLPDLGTGFDDGLKAVQTNELSKQEDTDKTTVTDSTCNDEDQSNIMNVTVISTDNLDSLNTSTPMKGRGRKRKNSPSFNQSNVETPVSYQMEQSTSGRKRKKVNYSEMVNLAEDNNIKNEIEIENSIPGNLEGSHFNVKNVEDSSIVVKKKRGRPKRIKIDLHTDATNDQSNEVNKFVKQGNSENCNLNVEITVAKEQETKCSDELDTGESSNNQTESTGTLAPSKDLEECKTTEEFSFSVKEREKQKKIKGDLFSDVNNELPDEINEPSELKNDSAKSNSELNYCEVVKKKKIECSVDIDKNQQGHEFDMEFAADCPKPNKKKIKKDILVCGTGLNTVQLSNQQDGSHKPTLALSKDWEECKSKIDITAEENSFSKMNKRGRSERTKVEFDTGSDNVHSDNQIYECSSNVIDDSNENYQCAKSSNILTDNIGAAEDLKESRYSGKKRGRKKKCDPSFIHQANAETPITYQMEQSSSGRRRKNIVEGNPTNVSMDQSDSMIKSEITPTSEKSSMSMNIEATGANDLMSVHDVATGEGESMESQNQCAKSLNISTDKFGVAEDLKEIKFSGKIPDCSNTPAPLKKRGRKKKNEPSFIDQANSETPKSYQMEQSTSGRRRRKVIHLENEDIAEAHSTNVPSEQSDSMIKSEITPTSEKSPISMNIKATGANDLISVHNVATGEGESMESQNQCAKSLNISTDNIGAAEDLKESKYSGKKRGRKKKSDPSFIHQANAETPITYQMEQSSSGRRRRKVDHLENENIVEANPPNVPIDQSDSMIKSEITPTSEEFSMSMDIKATGGNDSMYVQNAATGAAESMESQSQCAKSLNISTDNFGVAEDSKDIKCSGKIPDCLNTPAPLKKRGRKKKNEPSFIDQANSETPKSYQMEQSTSGRRRREVIYLENENKAEAHATSVPSEQSDSLFKSEITPTSEKSPISMNIKATGANDLISVHNVATGEGESMESQSQCAKSLNISTDNFGVAEDLKDIECSGKIPDCLNSPAPLKKRGRKKKSDLSFIHQANSETPITYQMEQSSSGRRRREVNYLENENIVEANPTNVSIDQSDLMIKSAITPTSENTSMSMNIKATGAAESMESQSQCAKSLNISTDNFGVAEDLKDIKCSGKSPDCLNTPAPLKKRGRKKNSDSSFIHQASFETPLTHQMEQSSSGRMRRKVNYLEIENMVKARPPKVPIYQSNMIFKSEITSTSENSSMSMNIKATSGNDLMSVCVAATGEADSMESQNQCAKSLNTDNFGATEDFKSGEILDCLNAPTPLNKRGRKKKSEPPFIHHANDLMSVHDAAAAEADSMALESTPSSVKKYTFHGKTTVMLNSIFSAAFKPSDIQESLETQQQSTPVSKAKGNRGPRRSNAPFMVMDGEGNVLCVICEQKIPIADWDSHNLSKHYNLSWCKGQDIVPIDDEKYVKKVLKLHNKKEVRLTCYKCGQCSTSVHSYLVHFEECRGILVGGMVICAVCNIKMERDGWLLHKLRHNNLAWRIGDVPLDLNDKDFVMFVLNSLYKAKKPLYCDKCGQTKKSVIGYISHRSQCGVGTKEAHVECEICGKKMLPVSMLTHLKFVHGPKERKSDYFDVNIDTPLKKRKAAANALSMLEKLNGDGGTLPYFISQMNFKEHSFVAPLLETELKEHGVLRCKYKNCEFIVGDIETLQDHMASCRSKPNAYYTCTKCLSVLSKEENKEHLEKCHDITFSEDEYTTLELSDSEGENPKPKRKRVSAKTVLVNGVEKEIVFRKVPKCIMNCRQKSASSLLFPNAYEYSFNFYRKHYNDPNLFNDLRYSNNEWCLLKEDLIEKYLPKTTKSCRVAWKRVKSETCVLNEEPTFKEFELFEYMQDAHNTTIFCGGPISALAWMPTPFSVHQCEQILAVATLKDFEENYTRFKYRHEPSLIQFWNFGLLRNRAQVPEPKLHFCLAVDFGPVWEIEWCPSGCFDQNFSGDFGLARSGVLAVSGSVPSVHIYAVPVLPDDQRNLIYKVKPLLKLQMVLELEMMKRETYPSKMSWSKAQGHKLLAVGYTDGSVGIFDLATNSQLLKFKDEEGVDVLLPYRVIKAHKYSITALTMIHLSGGARWLFTGSFDKCANVWDLNDDSSCQTNVKRIITGGSWLTHWVAFITAYDESSSLNAFNNGIVNPHRNFLSDSMAMLRSQSTISSFSFNDWLNACLQSTSEGEICLYLPSQMLYCMDVAKLPSFRYCLNSTYLIDTTKSIEERIAHHLKKQDIAKYLTNTKGGVKKLEPLDIYESLMYKETTDKYGLLFCDLSRDNVQDFPRVRDKNFEMMKLSSPNMYPLQTVTKISFNPNCFSSLYFATGHQAGFVRLNYLKFLENDAQVKS
ncbi:unnamed protein product [Phaedon cochleariae]|uniref:Uncharacterized protein n=1 Tax=Phaedon cochleariae TaxID=80249 RepID=A0A9P0DQF3_PHACE|nr:unnamed protein product [Phaedon cochleariae]